MNTAVALLAALGLATCLPGTLRAQVGAAAVVRADVVDGLTLLKSNDLGFGRVVLTGAAQTVTVAHTDPGAGKFTLRSTNNRDVTITLSPPDSLSNGVDKVGYAWAAHVNRDADTPVGAAAVAGLSFTVKPKHKPVPSDPERFAYIYIHGDVVIPATLTSRGTYTGTFTVSAAY